MNESVAKGKLFVVGIGPGSLDDMTLRARRALEGCDVVVGYTKYIELVRPLCEDKVIIASGMGGEIERCRAALREALLGKQVALVSSGDAGIYGMAGLVLEIAHSKDIEDTGAIEIIPGVPAFAAAAARVGAPLMHDFASISLSDLLTAWEKIEKRLEAAAQADFVTCLYNPKSKKRTFQIERAREIFLQQRNKNTPCAIVRNVSRSDESAVITTLDALLQHEIDMFCMVIIGNSETRSSGPWLITPRGYGQLHSDAPA
ncbi:precorrin-3B C(17)-methyltransferase [Thermodesulfobacteriota bacterium]